MLLYKNNTLPQRPLFSFDSVVCCVFFLTNSLLLFNQVSWDSQAIKT